MTNATELTASDELPRRLPRCLREVSVPLCKRDYGLWDRRQRTI
jgi:hypothetical protein